MGSIERYSIKNKVDCLENKLQCHRTNSVMKSPSSCLISVEEKDRIHSCLVNNIPI